MTTVACDVCVVPVFPDGDASSGALADALTAAFAAARDATTRPGDCIVFVTDPAPEVAAAVASLTRSLALEWAPEAVRVNAICADAPEQAATTIAWLGTPPALMLTGAVLDAR
jgi:hypothetical protein